MPTAQAKRSSPAANSARRRSTAQPSPGVPPRPEMVSFVKAVLRPGKYKPYCSPTALGAEAELDSAGKPTGRHFRTEEFDVARLQRIATNAEKMLASGLKIPAPFKHRDGENKLPMPVVIGGDGASLLDPLSRKPIGWDSSLNGGFWSEPRFVEDASLVDSKLDPGPAFISTITAPGSLTDHNSPAGKLGTTIQETSVCVLPEYEDPQTHEKWQDFPAHIALAVNGIEAGQDNFELISQPLAMSAEIQLPYAVTMAAGYEPSAGDDDDETDPAAQPPAAANIGGNDQDADFAELLGLLRQQPFNLDLPQTVGADNFVEILSIVVRQRVADQKTQATATNPTQTPPSGSQNRPAPIAMSGEEDAGGAIDMSAATINPVANALLRRETTRLKTDLTRRVKKLVANGIISQARADELIVPDINAICMSAENMTEEGDFPTVAVEKTIALLESTGRPLTTGSVLDGSISMSGEAPNGSYDVLPPSSEAPDLDAETINAIVSRAIPVHG